MVNKLIAQKSTCAVCGCKKTFFLKEGFKIKKKQL